MPNLRTALAAALLAAGLSAAISTPAAAACPALPPAPAATAAADVAAWLGTGTDALTCLQAEFSAARDTMSHQDKAKLVAQINALTYEMEQVRLDAQAATRRGAAQQTAELPIDFLVR